MALSVGQITIVDVNDGSFIVEKYASNTSYTIAPSSGWSNNIPGPIEGQFVWKKQRREYANGSTSNWSEPIRITGIPGTPGQDGEPGIDGKQGQLGLSSNGVTLYLKGFNLDGTLTSTIGYLFIGNTRYTVNEYSQELTNDGQGYVIFDGINIIFAKMISNSSGSNWVNYNDSTIINSAFWVIGTFYKNGNSIFELEIIQPQSRDNYEKSNFMNILASGDIDDINTWATANGVANVLEKIAIMTAFVNKMFANDITVYNKIKSEGYTGENTGFSLSSGGVASFNKAILKDIELKIGGKDNKLMWVQKGQTGDDETVSKIGSPRCSTDILSKYYSNVSYDGVIGQNTGNTGYIPLPNRPNVTFAKLDIYFDTDVTLTFNLKSSEQYITWGNSTTSFVCRRVSKFTKTFSSTDNFIRIHENTSGADLYNNVVSFDNSNTIIFDRSANNNSIMTITIKKVVPLNALTEKTLIINGVTKPKYYTAINGFYNFLPAENILYKIDENLSNLKYRDVKKNVSYIVKTNNTLTFFFEDNTTHAYYCDGNSFETSEFASKNGWGEIYGTIYLIAEERGIVLDKVLPFKNSSNIINSTIGSLSSPFKKIYAEELHGKCYAT
jgi:hypothetical protein